MDISVPSKRHPQIAVCNSRADREASKNENSGSIWQPSDQFGAFMDVFIMLYAAESSMCVAFS